MTDKKPEEKSGGGRKWFAVVGDALKNALCEDDETASRTAATTTPTAKIPTPPASSTTAPSIPAPAVSVQELDQELVSKIRTEVEQANANDGLAGFIETARKLEPIITDENQRLKAALATSGTLSLIQLQTGVRARIASLDTEEREFEQENREQYDGAATTQQDILKQAEADVIKMNAIIEAANAKIKAANAEIEEANAEIVRLGQESEKTKKTLEKIGLEKEKSRARFMAAKGFLRTYYDSLLSKITSALQ